MSPSASGKKPGRFENLMGWVIKRRKTVIITWVIALLLLTPAIMAYGNYVSYSSSTGGNANSESAQASRILSSINPQNSTLTVVVSLPSLAGSGVANRTLDFQNNITQAGLPYFSKTSSAFSQYSAFIDGIAHQSGSYINYTYAAIKQQSDLIFWFPSSFYQQWDLLGLNTSLVYTAAVNAGYSNSTQENYFLSALNSSIAANPASSAYENTANATSATALQFYGTGQYTPYILSGSSILNYTTAHYNVTSKYLSSVSGNSLSPQFVESVVNSPNPGHYYVTHYGLLDAPSFILKQYVSPDMSTMLISVELNVSDSYRGSGNFYPAQSIVPQVRNLTVESFDSSGSVTGTGAVSYDTQQSQSNSFLGFILTFVFLAVIVGIVLRSYISPILALVLVSISTVLGYVAIYIVGVGYKPVNYIVTYTLTAVLLGVATDYLLFILSRFKEELSHGTSEEDAILTASAKSGKAVLVSGVTVASSLGTMFFVSGLTTWGPVLFIAVLLTVLAEITFLPAVASLLGRRLFRSIKGMPMEKSAFYSAAKYSSKKGKAVAAAVLIAAAPAVYLWFTAPVSYDLTGELPSQLPSVQALNLVNQKFGESALYPVLVVMNLSTPAISGLNISQAAYNEIAGAQGYISSTNGIASIIGPTAENGTIGNTNFLFNNNRSAYFIVELNYTPYSQNAINSVQHLRDNSSLIVGGLTSGVIDLKNTSQTEYTLLELLIVASIGIIIGVSFRSLKFPVIALSGVFISISWTLGLLYLLVTYVLHEALIFLIPAILFIILMSLGNDFTVFLISRIDEEQRIHGYEEGLFRGMAGSGSVVTALGVILAASLGSLSLVPIAFLQQMGLAFAISLIIDTFVIRTLYFPAMITLLRGRKKDQVRKS